MRKSIKKRLHDAIIWSFRKRSRTRRAKTFVAVMKPWSGCSILDLGGGDGEFLDRIRSVGVDANYVVADIAGEHVVRAEARGFSFVTLHEQEKLPFGDRAFDIVLCNSVIEHVTLPKHLCSTAIPEDEWKAESWKRQVAFADEIRRISRFYFVQTPHKNFPVEQHTVLPGVNWLSHARTLRLLRWTDRVWIRPGIFVDWNLLGTSEMAALFPEAKLLVERVAGLPKSIISYLAP